jgi:hypothetical protein
MRKFFDYEQVENGPIAIGQLLNEINELSGIGGIEREGGVIGGIRNMFVRYDTNVVDSPAQELECRTEHNLPDPGPQGAIPAKLVEVGKNLHEALLEEILGFLFASGITQAKAIQGYFVAFV